MKTVTIEHVENGYIVTFEGRDHVATCVYSYTYEKTSLVGVLKEIFETKPAALEVVRPVAPLEVMEAA